VATRRRFVAIFDIRAPVSTISIQCNGYSRDYLDKDQIFQARHYLGAWRLSLNTYNSRLCHINSILDPVARGC